MDFESERQCDRATQGLFHVLKTGVCLCLCRSVDFFFGSGMIIGSAKAIVFFDTSVDDVSSLLVPSPIPGDIVHDQLDIALNTSMLPPEFYSCFWPRLPASTVRDVCLHVLLFFLSLLLLWLVFRFRSITNIAVLFIFVEGCVGAIIFDSFEWLLVSEDSFHSSFVYIFDTLV